MAETPPDKKSVPESKPAKQAEASVPPDAPPLTPEEQMAAFEKDLKENDWGHQPC